MSYGRQKSWKRHAREGAYPVSLIDMTFESEQHADKDFGPKAFKPAPRSLQNSTLGQRL